MQPISSSPIPEDSVHGAFLVTADGAGALTADDVRSRRFVAPSRGVRYESDTQDAESARCASALIAARSDAGLCDITAARHWSLPLPPWLGLEFEQLPVGVAVPAGLGRPQRTGVRGRRLRLPPGHLVRDGEVTVTTPARTWVDCAELIPMGHLLAMGDVILRRGLATTDDLSAMVRWARGRRGVRSARAVLPFLDPGSESPGESLARWILVQGGVPRPACNVDISDRGGFLARADMAWLRERVIVEYGGIVHLPEEQRRKDAVRRNLLQDAGWAVLVFTAADLTRPERMVWLVRAALARRS